MKLSQLPSLLALSAGTNAASIATLKRQTSPQNIATIDLSATRTPSTSLASGFIYGWPDNGTSASVQIPSSFVTPINFRTNRAGGAQLSAPNLGWAAGGYETYIGRFNSSLSNYRTTRLYGGDFILLPHDLWGADGKQDGGSKFPGDNGDWTEMETFWTQVVQDLKGNDMLEGLVVDVWNEPDVGSFWGRDYNQYLEYWVRAVRLLRRELPGTLLSGPSLSASPLASNSRWTSFLNTLSSNPDTIPDIYSWHHLGDLTLTLDETVPSFHSLLASASPTPLPAPTRDIDINEYAWPTEQNPAGSAWFMSQLERHELRGLRAHWGSAGALHDAMANIVHPVDGDGVTNGYEANGEWWLYQYYAEMAGAGQVRVGTEASGDGKFDVFATWDETAKKARVIAGTRIVEGTYEIKVAGLNAGADVNVKKLVFDFKGPTTATGPPRDEGVEVFKVGDGGELVISLAAGNTTAYAFEIEAA